MNIGIYVSGLGQSVKNQPLLAYAQRFMQSLDVNNAQRSAHYALKTEKITFGEFDTEVITITEEISGVTNEVYRFYNFNYDKELCENFNGYNIFIKNLFLFSAVVQKFPTMVVRLFKHKNYSWAWQSLYVFFIFFVLALFVLMLLPTALTLIANLVFNKDTVHAFRSLHIQWLQRVFCYLGDNTFLSEDGIKRFAKSLTAIAAIVAILIPGANLLITNLATDFVCAHYYLGMGKQAQRVLGKMQSLVEYIGENEPGCKIHFHAYSFGCIICIDYLFPFGSSPSTSLTSQAQALIMTGSPYEFVSAYYPGYMAERIDGLDASFACLNVYSVTDALSSNFRADGRKGEAMLCIAGTQRKPLNINYEIARIKRFNLLNFIMFDGIKAHACYWDDKQFGMSCLTSIVQNMKTKQLV